MYSGWLPVVGKENSVTSPAALIRPQPLPGTPNSANCHVNQTAPSRPTVSQAG
jgi:hypothetical protein